MPIRNTLLSRQTVSIPTLRTRGSWAGARRLRGKLQKTKPEEDHLENPRPQTKRSKENRRGGKPPPFDGWRGNPRGSRQASMSAAGKPAEQRPRGERQRPRGRGGGKTRGKGGGRKRRLGGRERQAARGRPRKVGRCVDCFPWNLVQSSGTHLKGRRPGAHEILLFPK